MKKDNLMLLRLVYYKRMEIPFFLEQEFFEEELSMKFSRANSLFTNKLKQFSYPYLNENGVEFIDKYFKFDV
jgi:hypothetical protein